MGLALIHGFQKIDSELVGAELRGRIEASVDQIAKGKLNFE